MSLQILHALLELLATILHVLEEVETCATRTEKHATAWLSHLVTLVHTVLHALDIGNRNTEVVECSMKL